MLSNQKYRISNMAKDLGVKSKDICDMLEALGKGAKTHMAVLEPEEYNYVLSALTEKNQVKAIDAYIHGEAGIKADEEVRLLIAKEEESKKKEAEAAARKAVEEAAAAVEAAKAEEKRKAEMAAAEARAAEQRKLRDAVKTAEEKAVAEVSAKIAARKAAAEARLAESQRRAQTEARAKAAEKSAAASAAAARSSSASPRPGTRTSAAPATSAANRQPSARTFSHPQAPKAPRPAKTKQPKQARPQQQTLVRTAVGTLESGKIVEQRAGRANARVVDTRTTSVDLSRYDEKLNTFVGEDTEIVGDRQKLKKQNNNRDRDSAREKERMALEKLRRQELERARKQPLSITVPDTIVVSELASRLKVTAADIVKRLMLLGVMASVNQTIDYDTAFLVAEEIGAKVTREVVVTIEDKLFNEDEDSDDVLISRAPVVVVMGHVDHGKTSLLDRIRHSNVTAGEAGGITQAIGAYRVNAGGKDITFLDTPGHAAFTAMRARGANATDIAILVVAADDGIMPQTVESISHAKEAGLQIIVAINKMDKPGADPDTIKQSLTKYDLVPEEWGGDVMCVPVSAVTGMGIDQLLDDINLIAEMQDYKANPDRRAKGIVIESRLDKGRGPVATVLVQNGTLRTGDVVIAGTSVGRVRAMTDDNGKTVTEAGPSVPVEIYGLSEVPAAGDECNAVEDERMARELAEQRRAKQKEEVFKANSNVSLDDLFAQISEGAKELKIIVKADVDGSAEAVKSSLEKLSNEEVKVKIIHTAVGGITESDVMFAAASNAIIVGFNVRPDKNAIDSAERQKVDIRTYRIIYECIEEVEAAMKGMLAPKYKENLLGHVEVRQTIHVPSAGTIAGSYVQDGKITRSAQIRVTRDGVVIFEDKISSLRRFKDDVREVAQGYECGVGLERFNDIKVGDILEAFEMVEIER